MIGCTMPRWTMEPRRSPSWPSLKYLRGLRGFGRRNSIGTLRAACARSGAVASSTSPIRAASPRPSRGLTASSAITLVPYSLCRASGRPERALALKHLRGQSQVGLRAGAFQIVEQHGLAVRGRLGHAHVAGDHGLIDLLAHILAHVRHDLPGQIVARVEHRKHDAVDAEPRVEAGAHLLDRFQELAQALQ